MLWLFAAVHPAFAIACDEITARIVADVPEDAIVSELVASLRDGLPKGPEACFARIGLPAPPIPGALAKRVYLLALYERFPCHRKVLGALLAEGVEAPECLQVGPGKQKEHWPDAVRARLRRARK